MYATQILGFLGSRHNSEKKKMNFMITFNRFLSMMLLVAGFFLAGHVFGTVSASVQASEEDQAPIHISERVKIERPAPEGAAVDPDAEEQAAEEESPPAEETAEAPDTAPEPETLAEEAVERSADEDFIGEGAFDIAAEDRYYDETGRVDPFAPFLRRAEPEAEEGEGEEDLRRIPRTPLERISLGQLTLTAVIMAESKDMVLAMVEDARGKGYVVREGTYIGEDGGRISRILPNKVIVEEPHKDVFGKTTIRERELQLQRQAGE